MSETTNGEGMQPPAIMDPVEVKSETRRIRRPAAPLEQAVAGIDLVELLDREEEIHKNKKAAAEVFKEQLDAVVAQIGVKRTTIRQGTVDEEVRVDVEFHPNTAKIQVWRDREDAEGEPFRELVEERAMTADELQARRQLTLAPAPPPDNLADFPGTSTPSGDDSPAARFRHADGSDTLDGVKCDDDTCLYHGRDGDQDGREEDGDGDQD